MKKLLPFVLAGFLSEQALAKDITIANWNMMIFSSKKIKDTEKMQIRKDIINKYDIIFVQEIRDKSGITFPALCKLLPEYKHLISSRAGRKEPRENYGVLYKGNIKVKETKDYNPDSEDRWERPPYKVVFKIDDYFLNIFNIHIDPDVAPQEMSELEKLTANSTGNTLVCGDLNADCRYYNRRKYHHFSNWAWITPDDADTAVSKMDCAYDRFIANNDAKREVIGFGVNNDKRIKEKKISDHYPVWVKISPKDK